MRIKLVLLTALAFLFISNIQGKQLALNHSNLFQDQKTSVVVDKNITPVAAHLSGSGENHVRPLSRIQFETGVFFDFVNNEVMLKTRDEADLYGFLRRWGGTIRSQIYADDVSASVFIIEINPKPFAAGKLTAYLKKLGIRDAGKIRVSHRQALNTIGVIAFEAARNHLEIGISMDLYLTEPDGRIAVFDLFKLFNLPQRIPQWDTSRF